MDTLESLIGKLIVSDAGQYHIRGQGTCTLVIKNFPNPEHWKKVEDGYDIELRLEANKNSKVFVVIYSPYEDEILE